MEKLFTVGTEKILQRGKESRLAQRLFMLLTVYLNLDCKESWKFIIYLNILLLKILFSSET